MISHTEENYLKAIYKISEKESKAASTNAIAKEMSTSAASVTDMLKRLSEKGFINYAKYKGVTLTDEGDLLSKDLIRKHRLWEVFLVNKLNFSWDAVHEIAEQLEHIKSDMLVERLDKYLGYPKFDPHGDPIPDAEGNIIFRKQMPLCDIQDDEIVVVVGVQEHSRPFLQYLDKLELGLGAKIHVKEKFEFDNSMKIILNESQELILTHQVCQNLFVQKN